jgi:HSP20 family protein
MALVRYPAWRELDEVTNRLARMFDDASVRSLNGRAFTPAVSVSETPDALVVSAELPGLSEKDVNVEIENGVLTISGEKTEERTEGDESRSYHVWERSYGSFRRAFALPRGVTGGEAKATFDKGVLEIRIAKAPEAKSRKIEISKN